jgi:hypothetical protein
MRRIVHYLRSLLRHVSLDTAVRPRVCDACTAFREARVFRSRHDISRAIRDVKDAERAGILVEVPAGRTAPPERVWELSNNGPWEDVLDNRMQCTRCSREFHLFADTYHGGGGLKQIR